MITVTANNHLESMQGQFWRETSQGDSSQADKNSAENIIWNLDCLVSVALKCIAAGTVLKQHFKDRQSEVTQPEERINS